MQHLIEAIRARDTGEAARLIEIMGKMSTSRVTHPGSPFIKLDPLNEAAMAHLPVICSMLIKAGADPNDPGSHGLPPLMAALASTKGSAHERFETVLELLRGGARPYCHSGQDVVEEALQLLGNQNNADEIAEMLSKRIGDRKTIDDSDSTSEGNGNDGKAAALDRAI